MSNLKVLPSELVIECLVNWMSRAGEYAPSVGARPEPIREHQIGPTVAVGGIILGCLCPVTVMQENGMYMTDLLIVRSTLPTPEDVLPIMPGTDPHGTEIVRLERDIRSPEHQFILGCAGAMMSVYFGIVAGDLGKFGQPLTVRRCLPLAGGDAAGQPGQMIVCPECQGYVFPGRGHETPVFRHDDCRLVYQSFPR